MGLATYICVTFCFQKYWFSNSYMLWTVLPIFALKHNFLLPKLKHSLNLKMNEQTFHNSFIFVCVCVCIYQLERKGTIVNEWFRKLIKISFIYCSDLTLTLDLRFLVLGFLRIGDKILMNTVTMQPGFPIFLRNTLN
jgi:hypothetical protein